MCLYTSSGTVPSPTVAVSVMDWASLMLCHYSFSVRGFSRIFLGIEHRTITFYENVNVRYSLPRSGFHYRIDESDFSQNVLGPGWILCSQVFTQIMERCNELRVQETKAREINVSNLG